MDRESVAHRSLPIITGSKNERAYSSAPVYGAGTPRRGGVNETPGSRWNGCSDRLTCPTL